MTSKPVASVLPLQSVSMKLIVKMILVAVAVTVAVASAQAIWRAQRMSDRSLHEMRHDLAELALVVGNTADELWRGVGAEAAVQLIERVDQRGRGHEQIRLVPGSAAVPTFSARAFAALSSEDQAARVAQHAGGLVITLTVGDGQGLLEIRRPLHAGQSFASSMLWSDALYILALALLSGVALLIAGSRLVGRPLGVILDQVRALAKGDRGPPVDVPKSGELAMLAVELERLSERLARVEEEARRDRRMRTIAFERLRHADRLSTVGKIASSMAHDLGTPLNVVSGRAMMILSTPGCSPEIASDARIIGEQANSMTQIIRQVLEYSRRRDLQRTSVHVHELIDRAIVLVEPLAEEQGVTIEHVAPDRDRVARLDEHKVLQILTNLMINGVQAMSSGGRLRMQSSVLVVEDPPDSRAAAGTYLRISVEDNGVGIEAKALATLFEPFFTTKGKGQGSGLGLPVCQGIIREHGGWIDVHSQVGQGSRFDVYLPLSNDEGV